MKKKSLAKKLSIQKFTVSELNHIKGGLHEFENDPGESTVRISNYETQCLAASCGHCLETSKCITVGC